MYYTIAHITLLIVYYTVVLLILNYTVDPQIFQHSVNEIKEIGEFEEEIDPVLLFPPLVDGISYHSVNTYDQKNINNENEKEVNKYFTKLQPLRFL